MNGGIIIGIEAGTSVMKSVAFTCDGRQLAVAAIPDDYVTLPDGGVEQDMARTRADAAAALRQPGEIFPDLASRVIAISVTAQGDGMWLIGREGEPVCPATIWLDNRAASIVENYVGTKNYTAHYERTGTGLTVVQMQQKLFPDMAACAKAWVDPHLGASTYPDGQLNGCHDKLFPHFVAARKVMRSTWQGLRETGLA